MLPPIVLSSVIGLAAFVSEIKAHGVLEEPKPTWKDGENVNWVTLVDNYWDIGSGGDQVGKFKTMAKEKGMSVKDVVLDMVKDQTCGNTLADGEAQPIPSDGKVKWRGNEGGGFTHTGPCEIYLDDKMVLHSDDCENDYPGGANGSNEWSVMPVDFSSCHGKCTLTIYWLAFQNAQWQTYVNCVPLTGSGGSTTQTQTQSTASSSTGTQSTEAPTTETGSAEASSTGTETQSTEASTTGTESTPAPAATSQSTPAPATTEAPSTETQAPESPSTPSTETDTKCTPARRRLRK